MWYLMGASLDTRRNMITFGQPVSGVPHKTLRVSLMVYGAFIISTGITVSESLGYARRFEIMVCSWGLTLLVVNSYLLLRNDSYQGESTRIVHFLFPHAFPSQPKRYREVAHGVREV